MRESKVINRYNDDYYLQFEAIDNQYMTANTTMPFLNVADWSISYFVKNDDVQLGVHLDFRNPSDVTKGMAVSFQTGNNGIQFKSGTVTHIFGNHTVNQKKNINHIALTYNNTTNTVKCYVNTEYKGEVSGAFDFENISPLVLGRVNWSSGFVNGRLKGGLRDMLFTDSVLTTQEIEYIYETQVPPVSAYPNIQHYYPLNQVPYESVGNYFMRDVASQYNPLATTTDVELIGWTTDELGLGVDGIQSQTSYKGWGNKKDYRRNSLAFTNSTIGIVNNDMTTISIAGDWTFTFRINPYKRPYGTVGAKYLFWSGTSNVDLFAIRLTTGGTFIQSINCEFVYSSGGSNTDFVLFNYEDVDYATTEISKRDICCSLRKTGDNIDVFVQGIKTSTEPIPVSTFNNLSNSVAIFSRNNGNQSVQNVGCSHISLCKDILTDSDIMDIYNKDYSSLVTTDFEYYPSDSTSKKIIDVSGNGLDYTYTSDNKIQISSDTAKPNDYSKGLNFDSTKSQYLEVTGLEAFDFSDGYTLIVGWKNIDDTLPSASTPTLFANVRATSNYADYLGMQFQDGDRTVRGFRNGNQSDNSVNRLDVDNMSTFTLTPDLRLITAYSPNRFIKTMYRNGDLGGTSTDISQTQYGFNETQGKFSIGALDPGGSLSRHYTGKIKFCMMYKGVLTQEEQKKIYNNGLYRSPYEVLEDTSKIILDVDFTNPFLDGSDVKFTDNSGNCVVTAKQNSGTDWTTLSGVQASID